MLLIYAFELSHMIAHSLEFVSQENPSRKIIWPGYREKSLKFYSNFLLISFKWIPYLSELSSYKPNKKMLTQALTVSIIIITIVIITVIYVMSEEKSKLLVVIQIQLVFFLITS